MKAVLVDLSRCCGCKNCQIACKDEHCEQPWLPYTEAQPEIGQFWTNVLEDVQGQVPMSRVVYTPVFCGHCDNCPALALGEADGSVYRREDGIIVIDPVKAKGRRDLAEACPQGMVFWNDDLEIPQKCAGCAHLMDNGWEMPRCMDVCNTDALYFGEESELLAKFPTAHVPAELEGMGAHVYYMNDLKYFVGGSVVNLDEQEAILGAEVTLLSADGDIVATQLTDDFGEFQFMAIDRGQYKVVIEADGYEVFTADADASQNSLYLGVLAPVACEIGDTFTITGTVRDYADEEPVPEARVVLRTEDKKIVAEVQTGDDGAFSIAVAKPAKYQVIVFHDGFTEEFLVADARQGAVDLGDIYPDKDWKHPYTRNPGK